MKTLKFTSFALLIMALVSFTGTPISIASSNDDNHLSQNDSIYSPPGYMNKDIQQARTLSNKYLSNKDKADAKEEAMQRDVSRKVETQAQAQSEKPKPVIQQKQSSAKKAKAVTGEVDINKNIKIGSGADQVFEGGRLMSEVINGTRYSYAGFDKYGNNDIQAVIDKAASGDTVIIRGGKEYNVGTMNLKEGVNIYGGYGENGTRDISNSATTLLGQISINNSLTPTEINGITFNGKDDFGQGWFDDGAALTVNACNNLRFVNNTFVSSLYGQGVYLQNGYLDPVVTNNNNFVFQNNNFIGERGETLLYVTAFDNKITLSSLNNNFINAHAIFAYQDVTVYSTNDYFDNTYKSNALMGASVVVEDEAPLMNSSFQGFKTNAVNGPAGITSDALANPYSVNLEMPRYAFDKTAQYSDAMKSYLRTTDSNISSGSMGLFGKIYGSPSDIAFNEKGRTAAYLESALALPVREYGNGTERAIRLSGWIANPTEDQKITMNFIQSVLAATEQAGKEAANRSPEDLKKAQDDLLQAVANILLAQGVPDLLKSGDVSNVKAIFSELDAQRSKIMLEYTKGTKPYYENMIKDLAKNMAMLQGKNLLNPNITKDELSKLPPSELDKILEKIKNMKDRSFEEEYLLQQEQKYRKDYLDPSKKKLEGDMKGMLKSFTERLNDVLKTTDKK